MPSTRQQNKPRPRPRDDGSARGESDSTRSRRDTTGHDDSDSNDSGAGSNGSASAAPSLSDRAASGMRLARHLRKASSGGKIRKGFSLWRASKELPTAAAGAADLFKRHPVPLSLLAGAITTAGMLYTAYAMGAFDAQASGGQEGDQESQEQNEAADARDESDDAPEEENEEADEGE